jgi:hypothetical protein
VCVDCEKQKSRKQEKVGGYQGIRNNNLTEIHRKIRTIKIQRRRKRKKQACVSYACRKEEESKKGRGGIQGSWVGWGVTITRSKVVDGKKVEGEAEDIAQK